MFVVAAMSTAVPGTRDTWLGRWLVTLMVMMNGGLPSVGWSDSSLSFSMSSYPATLVRRGLQLSYATLVYNCLEGVIAILAGLAAGSIALVGFGADSLIEVTASLTAIWRLRSDSEPVRRERSERISLRIIGVLFLALAAYVAADATQSLITRHEPEASLVGLGLAAASLVVMPLLANAKRRVALAMGSGALAAESRQTMLCTYLSAILLGGLILNAALGWWWADPAAALVMVPIIAREGIDAVRVRACDECCP
jgi:divalent metal cation (Fe/Co/Zn/Cd) transporter